MEKENKCAHNHCNCKVSGSDEYCSESCRESGNHDDDKHKCDCGHSGCK